MKKKGYLSGGTFPEIQLGIEPKFRLVKRYMGSGITAPGSWITSHGIRDNRPGIWNHKSWDQGSQSRDLGSQVRGSGITAPGSGITSHEIRISKFLAGSGIRVSRMLGIRNQNFWSKKKKKKLVTTLKIAQKGCKRPKRPRSSPNWLI